ncbi:hypothetical protein MSG28_002371 [Choristoneura fumiferana]|uniref:Uncharacterized protein n=2 Tax=Choristoneura fumiferana TaxID=7141 RepID=A0ACC0JV96_CHOFU|nr:hypothetical protein MSG28_002371 [Choristoneura fumiferana]
MDDSVACPVCNREFKKENIEDHVNKCLFLNTQTEKGPSKRMGSGSLLKIASPKEKRIKLENNAGTIQTSMLTESAQSQHLPLSTTSNISMNGSNMENKTKNIPLAEQMRPQTLQDMVGHKESFGAGTMLRSMLEQNKIPNMILWGPPGCGKTSMANVISHICKSNNNLRFVKLSATMSGINDVKEVVKVAKNEAQFKRQTVLFMDEIHRFNKLQQDSFLPHVENGTIILIGATTENPSFSLNNALLSRCKVIVMEKLSIEDVLLILQKAVAKNKEAHLIDNIESYKHSNDSDTTK